jgi:hypothetical protein
VATEGETRPRRRPPPSWIWLYGADVATRSEIGPRAWGTRGPRFKSGRPDQGKAGVFFVRVAACAHSSSNSGTGCLISVTYALRLLVNVQASWSPTATVTSIRVVPSAAGPGLPFSVQAIEVE